MIEAVILAQGDELTTGQTIDTNSNWLAERLWDMGLSVRRVITVPDRMDDLVDVIRQASTLAPVVVCTGGLGPTRDDLTAEAAGRAFDLPVERNDVAMAQVEAIFARWGRKMAESNRKQGWLPRGAEVIDNAVGTAPGFALEHRNSTLWFMPGVPREMKQMWTQHIEPAIRERHHIRAPIRHIVRVIGIGESDLEMRLRDLDVPGLPADDWTIAFRTRMPENQIKLIFSPNVAADLRLAAVEAVRDRIGIRAFGVDSGDLAAVVGDKLAARGETLALAESCTAGRLAAWVASVSGASRYLIEGAVVYANEAKIRTCGVDPSVLAEHGAVSEPVARRLAEGIRERADATWGIGITGIAGPTGGTPEKPVGTVHLAIAGPDGTDHRKVKLPGDRDRITSLAAAAALYLLYKRIAT